MGIRGLQISDFRFQIENKLAQPVSGHGLRTRSRYAIDFAALALITIVFVIMCAISWQKWAAARIDSGAAMNVPLRLLNGESLYTEVYYLYGPLAPYLNALLFRIFGVHLNVLYVAGILSSFLIALLTYQLGRRFMGPVEATAAALAVEALCIFKHGAHSMFPYTFSALYGTLLGVAALALQIRYTASQKAAHLIVSGILCGLALVCKQEFGFAVLASTLALAISARRGQGSGIFIHTLLPALAIPVFTYAGFALRMPYDVLFKDTFFLPHYIPREQVYYNSMRMGLNDVGKTMMEFAGATMIVCSLAALIGLISIRLSRSAGQDEDAIRIRRVRGIFLLCVGSSLLLVVILLNLGTVVYVSPLRALPLLCALLIWRYLQLDIDWRIQAGPRSVFLLSVFSLAVLARVITRVPSGGAYGLLLPVPLLAFIYSVSTAYPRLFSRFSGAQHYARVIVLTLCSLTIAIMFFGTAKRYLKEARFTLQTDRGTMRVDAAVGPAFDAALNFIVRNTGPQEFILALPEGSCLNFLAGRPAPLRYEVFTPGFLNLEAEKQAIQQLQLKQVKFIFLINRPTPEFGATAFGRDYYRELMHWIEGNYEQVVVFGQEVKGNSEIGDKNFFIKCYRLKV